MLNIVINKTVFVSLNTKINFMKAKLILLLLLTSVICTQAFATDNKHKQMNEKTEKSKYDFNIFKLFSIVTTQELPDSVKTKITPFTHYKKED